MCPQCGVSDVGWALPVPTFSGDVVYLACCRTCGWEYETTEEELESSV